MRLQHACTLDDITVGSIQTDGGQQPYILDDDMAATKKRGVPYNDPNLTKNFGAKCVCVQRVRALVVFIFL